MTKKYRALRFIAVLLRILAWVVLIGGVLGAIGVLISGLSGGTQLMRQLGMPPFASGVVMGIVGFLTFLFWAVVEAIALFATADYLLLLMDIETNTRATAHYLAEINRQYQAPVEE